MMADFVVSDDVPAYRIDAVKHEAANLLAFRAKCKMSDLDAIEVPYWHGESIHWACVGIVR